MNFRRATFEDGVFILKLLREFYQKHCGAYGIAFDVDTAMLTVDEIIHRGIFLVGPTSYAGALIQPCLWNNEATIATVMLWWFKKPREIRILDALLAECKEAGATHVVASSHFPKNTVGRLYARKSLHPVETQFIGQL